MIVITWFSGHGSIRFEGADALCDETCVAILALPALTRSVNRVLAHRELNSSAENKE